MKRHKVKGFKSIPRNRSTQKTRPSISRASSSSYTIQYLSHPNSFVHQQSWVLPPSTDASLQRSVEFSWNPAGQVLIFSIWITSSRNQICSLRVVLQVALGPLAGAGWSGLEQVSQHKNRHSAILEALKCEDFVFEGQITEYNKLRQARLSKSSKISFVGQILHFEKALC